MTTVTVNVAKQELSFKRHMNVLLVISGLSALMQVLTVLFPG
jgi:hypothetical protein